MIPKELKQITLLVTHNNHAETNLTVQWDAPDANQLVITMPPGYSVRGLVQDLNGNPVAGATVRQPRLNGEREHSTTTDVSGAYEFREPGGWRIDAGRAGRRLRAGGGNAPSYR